MSQEKYIAEIKKEAIQYAEKNYPNYSCAIFAESNHRIKIEQVSKDFIAGANSKAVQDFYRSFNEWKDKNYAISPFQDDTTNKYYSKSDDDDCTWYSYDDLLTEYKKGA